MNSLSKPQLSTLSDIVKKYIPQCDKQHHLSLRLGRTLISNYGVIQLPTDTTLYTQLQSQLQTLRTMQKTVVSGWRVYAAGLIYDQNKRTGEVTKQLRTVEASHHTDTIVMEYGKHDENVSLMPTLTAPNMEEEYERTVYTSSEQGLNELEWWFEHSVLSKQVSATCVLKKPVQFVKLWKHLEWLGVV